MGKKNKRRGRPKPHYRGKPLWQLLDNLPNHGVGRLIVRGSFKQNEEAPSYMRILEVDMSSQSVKRSNKGNKIKIPVKVDRIWRGVLFPRPVNITSVSYLADYILVPKAEEEKYLRNTKTASEKGYVYWTMGQKKRIRELIAQGLSPYEAKQRELERTAREQAEAGKRDGVKPSQAPVFKLSENNFTDNYDDVDAEETTDSFDSDYVPEEKKEPKKKKNRDHQTSDDTQNKTDQTEEFQNKHTVDEEFKNFSQEQKERIEKMIKDGMDPDTAKQLEWERQTALKAAAGHETNEAEAGPSSGLKRSCPQTTNAQGAKLSKID